MICKNFCLYIKTQIKRESLGKDKGVLTKITEKIDLRIGILPGINMDISQW